MTLLLSAAATTSFLVFYSYCTFYFILDFLSFLHEAAGSAMVCGQYRISVLQPPPQIFRGGRFGQRLRATVGCTVAATNSICGLWVLGVAGLAVGCGRRWVAPSQQPTPPGFLWSGRLGRRLRATVGYTVAATNSICGLWALEVAGLAVGCGRRWVAPSQQPTSINLSRCGWTVPPRRAGRRPSR
jgi:hypothetical protein